MKTGEIILKGQQHPEARINLARENHGLVDQDIIVISNMGYASNIETLQSASIVVGRQLNTLEEALEELLQIP